MASFTKLPYLSYIGLEFQAMLQCLVISVSVLFGQAVARKSPLSWSQHLMSLQATDVFDLSADAQGTRQSSEQRPNETLLQSSCS